ncbi:MAG TPA: hypothetical protein GXX28_07025 [Firmicutes bacterium]|nr:hypothetical protein [Bacillota bacterium]
MSRERFIAPEFWSDAKVGELSPMERLLFIGCFSNADDEGRLPGNPAWLRANIFPFDEITLADVKAMRDRLVSLFRKLVLYEVDGDEYLAFLNWDKYQKPKYKRPSKIPAPPASAQNLDETWPDSVQNLPESAGNRPCGSGSGCGSGVDVVGDVEGCGEPASTPCGAPSGEHKASDDIPAGSDLPPITEEERETLQVLRSVPGYPFKFQRDLEHIRNLAVEFPTVDILTEAKKWRAYKLDKPLKPNSNPRSQFHNWCEIASKQAPRGPGPNRYASPAQILDEWGRDG